MNPYFFLFLLIPFSPLCAQEETNTPPAAAPAAAEMPEELASAPLTIRIGGQERTYQETVGSIFLNKTFTTRLTSDGTERTYAYKPGVLSEGGQYMLPIEIRAGGRLHTIVKFFFRYGEGTSPSLYRWEEVNFFGRHILRHESFLDVVRGVDYFKSFLPAPPKAPVTPPPPSLQEAPPAP